MSNKQRKADIASGKIKPRFVELGTRMLRVADEDDCRAVMVDGSPVYANPRFLELSRKAAYGGFGWCPINIRLSDMKEYSQYSSEGWTDYQGQAAFFQATLTANGEETLFRVSCFDSQAQGWDKCNLTRAQALRLWARVNDHTTIRTLRRLGMQRNA